MLVTLPSGREARYRVQSIDYDGYGGMQITMVLEANYG